MTFASRPTWNTHLAKRGGLPFAIKKANLESAKSQGKILFDAQRGRIVEADASLRLVGSLVIEVGNMETTVELDQEQINRVRTMDKLPQK